MSDRRDGGGGARGGGRGRGRPGRGRGRGGGRSRGKVDRPGHEVEAGPGRGASSPSAGGGSAAEQRSTPQPRYSDRDEATPGSHYDRSKQPTASPAQVVTAVPSTPSPVKLPTASPVQAAKAVPATPSPAREESTSVVRTRTAAPVTPTLEPAAQPVHNRPRPPGPFPQQQQPRQQRAALPSPAAAGESRSSRSDASIFDGPLPPRPGSGREGSRIQLRVNHFPLRVRGGFIYHYDVDIVPNVTNRRVNRQVIRWLENEHADKLVGCKLAFDGRKNLYTVKPLPSSSIKLIARVALDGDSREKEFAVTIKYAAKVSLDVLNELSRLSNAGSSDLQTAVQAVDIIVSQIPSMRFESVGRSYFPTDGHAVFLGEGKELRFGYYQSVRPTMWSMVINVDMSATTFYKEQPVLELLADLLHLRRVPHSLRDSDRVVFAKEIRGLRIQVTHLPYPRKYRVVDVTRQPAERQTFPLDDGKTCTVKDYFEKTYQKRLDYPSLPCLHVGDKKRHIYIPMELAIVLAQHCNNKKLKPDHTKKMIRQTAIKPSERRMEIEKKVERARFDSDVYLREFGISVDKRMLAITGRVLKPPTLQSKESSLIIPRDGVWKMDSAKFYSGADIHDWGVVDIAHLSEEQLRKFVGKLTSSAETVGLTMTSDPCLVYVFERKDSVQSMFEHMRHRRPSLQLIVVILNKGRGHGPGYNEVKRVGDNMVGISTQCVLAETAIRADSSTMANLCLKINGKLGGINTIIEQGMRPAVFRQPVIIMGADVTHPAPGEHSKPSIAAVVASVDCQARKYRALNLILRHRQEVLEVDQLKGLVYKLLQQFYQNTQRKKPMRIIFYRDGVSEGQFREVIRKEVAAIQRACISLEEGYQPGITFLVVQKRHHTRLFRANSEDKRNIPAGTIVDQDITHPTENDFYLCSHQGIQGTSRPCHYHVLWDDNHFSADELQELSYQLCHAYARCNRSVSYPAPAYYAHHVAFRARYHLQDWEDRSGSSGGSDSSSTAASSSASASSGSLADKKKAVEVHEEVQKSMYFL